MPPRKKVNGATAGSPPEALRRSTRASKGRSRGSNNSSSDELSSASVALGGHDVRSIEAEASQNPRNEEVADEITVCTTRTTRSKSYTASRPSTANSDSASQSRVISAPVTKRDIQTLYDGDKEGQDELAAEGPTLKKPKPTIKLISNSARKGRSKFDNPDEMLTNPRAPLAIVNLRVSTYHLFHHRRPSMAFPSHLFFLTPSHININKASRICCVAARHGIS